MMEKPKNSINFNDLGGAGKRFLAEDEAESSLIKNKALKSKRIISDREISTLDFASSLHLIQDLGHRLIDNSLFPYLVQQDYKKNETRSALEVFNTLPDFFIEEGLSDIITDYLKESSEGKVAFEKLQQAQKLYQSILISKVSPQVFNKLVINGLNINENTQIFRDHLEGLPFSFQEHFTHNGGNVIEKKNISWKTQLDLKQECETEIEFSYLNFSNQLEEVRFALNKVKENKNALVLYPKRSGYESLFYLYQREFFEDQRFFYKKVEKNTIEDFLYKERIYSKGFKSHYDSEVKNKNLSSFIESKDSFFNFKEFVSKNFTKEFTELDLNIMSQILKNIGSDLVLSSKDWFKIVETTFGNEKNKSLKIHTDLPIKEYGQLSEDEPSDIYILGWGNKIFSKSGERIFSNTVLQGIERDLGVEIPSLHKSEALSLFKNRFIHDSHVKKHICFPKTTAKGGAAAPGAFKILNDKELRYLKTPKNLLIREAKSKRVRVSNKNRNLSQSSIGLYESCPHKFYLEKVIGLYQEDELDRFLPPKDEGSVLHKALENLKYKKVDKEEFYNEILKLCETGEESFDKYRVEKAKSLSENIWGIFQKEKKYIEDSKVKILSEEGFSFFADLEKKVFSKSDSKKKEYKIRGVIDRIDLTAEGRAIFYDYKRGKTGAHLLSNYNGAKLYPQIFLYCLAADYHFKKQFQELIGFQFINLKEYKRTGGYLKKEVYDKTLPIFENINSRSLITEEMYNEKFKTFLSLFWDLLNKIDQNVFEPNPNSNHTDVCKSCNWKGICKKSETFL